MYDTYIYIYIYLYIYIYIYESNIHKKDEQTRKEKLMYNTLGDKDECKLERNEWWWWIFVVWRQEQRKGRRKEW